MNVKKVIFIVLSLIIMTAISGCCINHDWQDATCYYPKVCYKCGETEGEPLEHNFQEGYCTLCGTEDPDYMNLEEFGFYNNYGMNEWAEIVAYDQNHVEISSLDEVYVFFDNYYDVMDADYDYFTAKKNGDTSSINITTHSNDILSNDLGGGVTSFRIRERVVVNDSVVILKGKEDGFGEYEDDIWFIPVDMLDLSSEIEEYTYYYGEKYDYSFTVYCVRINGSDNSQPIKHILVNSENN